MRACWSRTRWSAWRASPSCAASARWPTARIRIGAFTRHRETAAEHAAARRTPPWCATRPRQIANATVRNMGTIGGSISFADPGLDYPPALVAADAAIEIAGVARAAQRAGARVLRRLVHTALEPGEIVTAVLLPAPQPGGAASTSSTRAWPATTPPPRSPSASTATGAVARGGRRLRADADAPTTTPTRCCPADRGDAGDRAAPAPLLRGARRSARRRARQRRLPAPADPAPAAARGARRPKRASRRPHDAAMTALTRRARRQRRRPSPCAPRCTTPC